MSPDSSFPGKTDEDADREQLIWELKQLRKTNILQSDIIARYERIFKNNKRPVADVCGELEVQRGLIESLKREYGERPADSEAQQEELESRMEELRLLAEQWRETERALRESEEKFRVLAETSPTAILVYQGKKNLFVNHMVERISGYSRDELAKMDYLDLIHPDHQGLIKNRALALSRGECVPQHYEIKVVTKNREERWVDVSAGFIDYAGTYAGMITAVDITGRKRAEEALLESKASLARAQSLAHIGNWSWDLRTNMLEYSDECYRLLGYEPDEFKLVPFDFFVSHIHPGDKERFFRAIRDSIQGIKQFSIDFRLVKPDGSIVHMHDDGEVLYDAGEKPVGMFGTVQDITERKQAEDILKESEGMFRSTFEQSAVGMTHVGIDGRYLRVNKKYCDITGYTEGELLRLTPADITYPADIEKERKKIKRLMAGEFDAFSYEKRYVRKNGSLIWVKLTVAMVYEDGEPAYMTGVTEDITERKRVEEALRESEEKFRRVFENAAIGMLIADANRNYHAVNDRFCEMMGYGRDELLASGCGNLLHPDDQAGDIEDVGRLLRGEVSSFTRDMRYIRSDGAIVWVRVHVSRLPGQEEDSPRLIATMEDITEQKQAEEALREGKERIAMDLAAMTHLQKVSTSFVQEGSLDALLDDILEAAVFSVGADKGTLQLIKPGSGRLDIVAWRGFDQSYIDFFSSVSHGTAAVCATAFSRGERVVVEDVTKSPIFAGTPALDVQLKAGVRAVQSTPLVDRRGEMIGMLSTHWGRPYRPDERVLRYIDLMARQAADIIERKQDEEELTAEKQQAELYLDLMGHDINNLHQIALGYLELARDTPPGEAQANFLDKPVEVLQRSARLISNVRKLQKLREGVFASRDIDVRRVLADVQRELGNVPNKRVVLNVNGHGPCFVKANELLHDVFANLVGNAIKHTGDRANIVVDLDTVEDDGGLSYRVAVEDDGPGVPDDYKAAIFNRTLKGTKEARGMGLGLYLVKSLVDSYGGRVWVEDRVNGDHTKGARFVVMLPKIE